MKISGSCLCGAVKYVSTGAIAAAGNCHCLDCRKASGSGYAPSLFVPEDSVDITGEVRYFDKIGASGKAVHRGFCPNCGSQCFAKPDAWPGMLAIRAGSLDDFSVYEARENLLAGGAPHWDCMDPDLPGFESTPVR